MNSNTASSKQLAWEVSATFNFNGFEYSGKWFNQDGHFIQSESKAAALAAYCIGKHATAKKITLHKKQAESHANYYEIVAVVDEKFTFAAISEWTAPSEWSEVLSQHEETSSIQLPQEGDEGVVTAAKHKEAVSENKRAPGQPDVLNKANANNTSTNSESSFPKKTMIQTTSSYSGHNKIPIGSCKLCGDDVLDRGSFYGCNSYFSTGCTFTISKTILGKELGEENIKLLLSTGDTRLIEGLQHRKRSGTFKAVISWDNEEKKLIFKTPNRNAFKLPLDLLKPLAVYEPPEEDTLEEFRILERESLALKYPAKVINVTHGPRITRYELLPKQGINIAGYKRFKANYQAVLKAKKVALYIPIPGTNLVGIEIPSKHPYPVQLRGLLENEEFLAKKQALSFPIGMDLYGRPYFADLAEMPHLLVAGATGSGKSVFLNALILSLLYGNTPEQLRFMFIDPKQVELSVYSDIPHLFSNIVTNPHQAGRALEELTVEMDRRYKILQEAGVRNIDSYNGLDHSNKLPYIVVVIDEIADLLMTSKDTNVEHNISRLAQLGRASGLHLVVATQRPTKSVLSPTIKANLPVRVSFAVSSSADSMTILDQPGAEGLYGKGDMIYLPKDGPKVRLQSGYVSDDETKKVIRYLKENKDN